MIFNRWIAPMALLLFSFVPAAAQNVTGPPTDLTPGSITNDSLPRLNPTGTRVSYTSDRGWHYWSTENNGYTHDDGLLMNADGSDSKAALVRAYLQGSELGAAPNPDGTKVVLTSKFPVDGGVTDLWMVDVANSTATQLTNDQAVESLPVWSPDGTKVAFISDRNGSPQLYVLPPTPESFDNQAVQLTSWFDGKAVGAQFAPDGKLLVVKRAPADDNQTGTYSIVRMDARDNNNDQEGDNAAVVAEFPAGTVVKDAGQMTAGGRIFFVMSAADGRGQVFTMAPDGTGIHQLTGGTQDVQNAFAAGGKIAASVVDPERYGVGNADVVLFTVDAATANGTVSGKFTSSVGQPQAGAVVNAYDGGTKVAGTTTDANGLYTLSLPPGGYTLAFGVDNPASYGVNRSVLISSGVTTTQDAFTTPLAAPRPSGVIPTIKDGKVVLHWTAGNTPSTGWSVVGYNVYRGASETGPWTKITATPVADTPPLQYMDAAPGDLAKAFYVMTKVTTDGVNQMESAFSNVGQAANNLLFNPSFEMVDNDGNPKGWNYTTWWGDGTGTSSTQQKTDGTRSAELLTGATGRGPQMFHTAPAYQPVVEPGVPLVLGMFGKFVDAYTTWPLQLRLSPVQTYPDPAEWYPRPWIESPWDTPAFRNVPDNQTPTTPWVWSANTNKVIPYEFATYQRVSVYWDQDGLTELGKSAAFADEATYQVRRVGATGIIMGRITDKNGNPLTGATVSAGGVSVTTDGSSDQFILRGVPTGSQELKIEVPGLTAYTTTIPNYGGYRLPQDYVANIVVPLIVQGTVRLPNGQPAPGATVRLVQKAGDVEYSTTADAQGHYTFGNDIDNVSFDGTSYLVASLKGYLTTEVEKRLFGSGTTTVDLNVDTPDQIIEIGKTSTPPTIDGIVNVAEWSKSQPIDYIQRAEGSQKTTAYAMWDANNLYVAFVGDEPNPAGMLADSTGKDNGKLWWTGTSWNADDVFALWIDPARGQRTGWGYEQWQVLNNANQTDPSYADIAWRRVPDMWGLGEDIAGFQFKATKDTAGKRWMTEYLVPLSGIAVTSGLPGQTITAGDTEWILRFERNRHQPEPDGEGSSSGWVVARFVNTVTPLAKGDLDGNRILNSADAMIALRIMAGIEALGNRLSLGDINGDGKVDGIDAGRIIRKVNGLDNF